MFIPRKKPDTAQNPRYPYRLSVYRARLEDDGTPSTKDDGTPIYDLLPLELMEVGDRVSRPVSEIPFGYRTSTSSMARYGDVALGSLKLATPRFVTALEFGDMAVLTDASRTYRCKVLKKTDFNFGSNIWADEIHN